MLNHYWNCMLKAHKTSIKSKPVTIHSSVLLALHPYKASWRVCLYWWPSEANLIAIIQSVTGCELWDVFVSLDWSKFYICTTLLYSISRYFGSYYDSFRSILSRNKELISPCSKLTVMKWNPRCYSDKAVTTDLRMRHICYHSRNTVI